MKPDLPIILCTGHSETITEETAHAMGIRHFALKPLSTTQTAELVRRVLDAECLDSRKRDCRPYTGI